MSPLISRVSGGGAGRFYNKGFRIRRRIGKPRIIFPSNEESTDLAVAFTASSPEAVSVEHRDSDWQIATDSSFSNIINSVSASTGNKTSWQAGATYNGTLYVRVKYKNTLDNVESEWSDPVSFIPTASISSSSSESITAGNAYSASVTANNSTSVSYTYAWKKDGASIGSNSSSVNDTLYMYDGGKSFSCDISTPGCSTTYTLSRPSVSVASGVTATKNGGAVVGAGSNWSASLASLSGTPYPSSTVSYQWQFNGNNLNTGGTTSSVSFKSYYSDSGKTVRCAVTHTDNSGSGQSVTTNFDYTMSINRGAFGPYGGSVSTGQRDFNKEIFGSLGNFAEISYFDVPSSWWSVNGISGTISQLVINNDANPPTNETYPGRARTRYSWSGATSSYQDSTWTVLESYRTNNVSNWSSYQPLYGDSINSSYTPQNRTIKVSVQLLRGNDPNKSLQGRGNYTVNGTLVGYANDTRTENP